MREADWSRSPLGPPATWPQSLRSVVGLLLGSRFPMFVAWGPQLAMLYNDAYAEILGGKHPAGLGAPFVEVWADILDDIMPFVRRALGGEAFYVEDLPLRMRRRGFEEQTWFTFSYSPVRDEGGTIAGFYCACAETTRAVLVQHGLRERQQWLNSLFEQAPGFAAVLRGPDHVFDMVNEAYRRIAGDRPLVGKPVREALPEVAEQGFVRWLDEVYATGQPFVGRSIPVTVNHGDRGGPQLNYVDFMYQPLRDAAGCVEGIFVQGHDVTEQVRARQALQAADRQKDEFLATLAHELRNPLAPIRSAAALLAMPSGEDVRQRAVEIIGRQVGHMSRLLDDLIDVARITQRRLVLKKESLPVRVIVDAALETARPLAQAKRHALVAAIRTPDDPVHVDPVRMTQVLSNLLNNAVKYTDEGGTIRVEAEVAGDRLHFAVVDDGIGIDPAGLDKLFVMFAQQDDALARSEGGLGIGLALVKGLVELHGGVVSASSAGRGRGSRFEVTVPLERPPAEAGPHELPAAAAAGRPKLVLLADDNHDALEILAEYLKLNGFRVDTAPDGEQAAALASGSRPDVMVLDIGMPGLSGYEVARRVRAEPWGSDVLLIAATGWGQERDREKAVEAGFDRHLTKPFDPAELVALIERGRP